MAKAQVPDHIEKDYQAALKDRKALEDELQGHQEKLRKLGRTQEERAAHPEGVEHLARVNDVKNRLRDVAQEHVELARMRARILGGKNYAPPPG